MGGIEERKRKVNKGELFGRKMGRGERGGNIILNMWGFIWGE